jgi:RNA polymerase sigma-70 factor (ECF subfamily)
MHRAVVHLFYREDLSVEEIAAILDVPAGTVKSRLHHAREALRRQLGASAVGRPETASKNERLT